MSGPVDFLTGRALRPGYTADTAPAGMRWVYDTLAPAPGAQYGDVLPVKRDADGRLGLAMPNVMREGLLGMADLLSGTETGELTGRGAQSITMGGLGAGMTMAPRGALAAGGGRGTVNPPLAMDRASIDARAKAQGYLLKPGTDDLLTVYHGTNKEIRPGFRLDPPERATNAASAEAGIWASTRPEVAKVYAEEASRRGGTQSILPLRARATRVAEIRLDPKMTEMEMKGVIRDAWDAGYDAVRVTNYTTSGGLPAADNFVFKHPSQLRVPWAAFDPAKRDSSDLLAGFSAPAPVGLNVRETPPPGFDLPNHLRPLKDRVY